MILKSDGLPTYHLAAMVDDHHMKITHVLRGAEWLSTFPLHVNVVRAFGWEEPTWVHLSLFLKPSGKGKLSKRDASEAIKDGYSVFVKDLQDLGFIPEGVLNWIVLMGWGVAEDDVLTVADMVQRFDLTRLTASPAAINFTKLDHFNGTHIRVLSDRDFARRVKPFFASLGLAAQDADLERIAPLLKTRLTTLDDAPRMAGFFFRENVVPERADLVPSDMSAEAAAGIIQAAIQLDRAASGSPGRRDRGELPAAGGAARTIGRRSVWHTSSGHHGAASEPAAVPEHGNRRARSCAKPAAESP